MARSLALSQRNNLVLHNVYCAVVGDWHLALPGRVIRQYLTRAHRTFARFSMRMTLSPWRADASGLVIPSEKFERKLPTPEPNKRYASQYLVNDMPEADACRAKGLGRSVASGEVKQKYFMDAMSNQRFANRRSRWLKMWAFSHSVRYCGVNSR